MASLYEYFVKDGTKNLTAHETWPLLDDSDNQVGEAIARLHYDFEASALYISFYIPGIEDGPCLEAMLLNEINTILKWTSRVKISTGFNGNEKDSSELTFTGQIYLYSERPVSEETMMHLKTQAQTKGHKLTFRSLDYMNERNKWERPKAFISHDSRDKISIAEPLALQLQKFMCPVWYDQFSLRVGDSLRQSIEQGLKESAKCIFVLTPNFLSNGGWSKLEYDSIFTRELVEKKQVILPIWDNVTVSDVYQYSPILADRFAVQWSSDVENVARKLLQAIDLNI